VLWAQILGELHVRTLAGFAAQDAIQEGSPPAVPADRPGDRIPFRLVDAALQREVSGRVTDDGAEHLRLHRDEGAQVDLGVGQRAGLHRDLPADQFERTADVALPVQAHGASQHTVP
jgi:hypothetical protein